MTRTPLHQRHERLGATFGEADGLEVPLHYGDPAAEHEAVRERAGLIDRSGRGLLQATGRDRAAFLHAMLTSDVKALAPGQGCPAAFLDVHGRIVSLLAVRCLPDRLLLETDRELAGPTLAALDRFHFSERVELEDLTDREGTLTLAGPSTRKLLESVVDQAVPELAPCHHAPLAWREGEVRLAGSDATGEEGLDVWAPIDTLARLWDRLIQAGASPVGREAWEILRVEAGVVRYGVDVDAATLLLEAPLEGAYSLTKGCYVGQEVVARVTYRGHVNRKVVGFAFPDARVPAAGARVLVGEREVGRITSAVVSPALRRGLALGFLRREHWEPGTRVTVEAAAGGGPLLTAEVRALPFYRRISPGAGRGT